MCANCIMHEVDVLLVWSQCVVNCAYHISNTMKIQNGMKENMVIQKSVTVWKPLTMVFELAFSMLIPLMIRVEEMKLWHCWVTQPFEL